MLFQPETQRVIVGQTQDKNGKLIQKFVVAKTLVKDVVFEETYDTTMSTETDSGSTHSGGNASGPSAEG